MKKIEYNTLVIKEKRKIDSWRGRSGAAARARSNVSYWTKKYTFNSTVVLKQCQKCLKTLINQTLLQNISKKMLIEPYNDGLSRAPLKIIGSFHYRAHIRLR